MRSYCSRVVLVTTALVNFVFKFCWDALFNIGCSFDWHLHARFALTLTTCACAECTGVQSVCHNNNDDETIS